MTVTLDHVVFEVSDPEATMAFYRGVLQMAPVRLEEYRRGEAPFLSARVNAATILDFFPKAMWANKRKAANPNHFCLTMTQEEARKVRRRLKTRNIPILNESKRNYGARGYGVSVYFPDPDGLMVEVKYYRK